MSNDETAESVLTKHVEKVKVGQPTDVGVRRNLTNVHRNHVFEDGIAKMDRAKFDPSRPLSVKFADELGSSERAVDFGSPTCEFLHVAVREAFSSNAFRGKL